MRTRLFAAAAALPLFGTMGLVGCGGDAGSPVETGEGQLAVSVAQPLTVGDRDISRIDLQLYWKQSDGTYQAYWSEPKQLHRNAKVWTGKLGGLPLALDPLYVQATAYGDGPEAIFESAMVPVDFEANSTTAVVNIFLQQLFPTGGFTGNIAPVIESISVPSLELQPSAPTTFKVVAYDQDAAQGDSITLTGCWINDGPQFDNGGKNCADANAVTFNTNGVVGADGRTEMSVVWDTPANPTINNFYKFRFIVADANGGASATLMEVPVARASGNVTAKFAFNMAPVIQSITGTPRTTTGGGNNSDSSSNPYPAWGELSVVATDLESTSLTYAWEAPEDDADCEFATVVPADGATTTFRHKLKRQFALADGLCTVKVTVSDSDGGSSSATITVGARTIIEDIPAIVVTFQETDEMKVGWTSAFGVRVTWDDYDSDDNASANDPNYWVDWAWSIGSKLYMTGRTPAANDPWTVDKFLGSDSTMTWTASPAGSVEGCYGLDDTSAKVAPSATSSFVDIVVRATNRYDTRLYSEHTFELEVEYALCCESDDSCPAPVAP